MAQAMDTAWRAAHRRHRRDQVWPTQLLEKFVSFEAAHPIPDLAGLEGARQIAAMARQATVDDLIFVLLSGGGSALLPYPIDGLSLADKQTVTQLLLRSGATIHEINAVSRHLSQLKGGKLARMAYPAQMVSLDYFRRRRR